MHPAAETITAVNAEEYERLAVILRPHARQLEK